MPAYNSGLKEGDLIIEIDGNKIEKFSFRNKEGGQKKYSVL